MKVLVLLPVEQRHKEKLLAAGAGAEFIWTDEAAVTREQVAEADIILGNVPTELLPGAEKLQWLQLNYTGADAYVNRVPESVLLTSATGAFGLALAEHTMALLLALMKKIHTYYLYQQQRQWTDLGQVTSLWQSKVLIVGMDDIGNELAVRLEAFGAQVYGIRRHRTPCPPHLAGLYTLAELDWLLPQMDIVISVLPGGAATSNVFGAEQFRLMKKEAFFLNVGRGAAVVTMDLLAALEQGEIAGAALDVVNPEPLPENHPLWQAPNLLLTPHIAGQYHLAETLERVVDIAAYNLQAFLENRPLKSVVDRESGYRLFREQL